MRLLSEYLNGLPVAEQVAFAQRCGTTIGYLRKAISVGQLLKDKVCVRIEQETRGCVTRKDLHPDDWHEIWPELADSEQNPPAVGLGKAAVAINSEAKEAAHA